MIEPARVPQPCPACGDFRTAHRDRDGVHERVCAHCSYLLDSELGYKGPPIVTPGMVDEFGLPVPAGPVVAPAITSYGFPPGNITFKLGDYSTLLEQWASTSPPVLPLSSALSTPLTPMVPIPLGGMMGRGVVEKAKKRAEESAEEQSSFPAVRPYDFVRPAKNMIHEMMSLHEWVELPGIRIATRIDAAVLAVCVECRVCKDEAWLRVSDRTDARYLLREEPTGRPPSSEISLQSRTLLNPGVEGWVQDDEGFACAWCVGYLATQTPPGETYNSRYTPLRGLGAESGFQGLRRLIKEPVPAEPVELTVEGLQSPSPSSKRVERARHAVTPGAQEALKKAMLRAAEAATGYTDKQAHAVLQKSAEDMVEISFGAGQLLADAMNRQAERVKRAAQDEATPREMEHLLTSKDA